MRREPGVLNGDGGAWASLGVRVGYGPDPFDRAIAAAAVSALVGRRSHQCGLHAPSGARSRSKFKVQSSRFEVRGPEFPALLRLPSPTLAVLTTAPPTWHL